MINTLSSTQLISKKRWPKSWNLYLQSIKTISSNTFGTTNNFIASYARTIWRISKSYETIDPKFGKGLPLDPQEMWSYFVIPFLNRQQVQDISSCQMYLVIYWAGVESICLVRCARKTYFTNPYVNIPWSYRNGTANPYCNLVTTILGISTL